MSETAAVLPAIVTGSAALAGAVASQVVSAYFGLKSKRLDLVFKAKMDAYQRLMERVGQLVFEPHNYEKYAAYLAAYEAAFIVASDTVADALSGPKGLNISIQRLRVASPEDAEGVKATHIWESDHQLTAAMRADLRRAARGKL